MNKISLVTSAAGIALLLASAAPALADEHESDDVSVQASSSVSVTQGDQNDDAQGDENTGGHGGLFQRLGALGSTTIRAKIEQHTQLKASTTEKKMAKIEDKSAAAIDKRIEDLKKLSARLAEIKLIPADVLASIQASLSAEIQQLTDLKAKIASDTSTTTVKADAEDITKANRVYVLVEPKAHVAASDSRIDAVVTQLTTLAGKLQTRITAAQSAGVDVSAAVSAMTDMNAKLTDAKAKADAAVSETANLKADNGDKTVAAANLAALKDARAKLVAAQQDLAAARHDAATIYGTVKGKGGVEGKGSLHATTTATTTP